MTVTLFLSFLTLGSAVSSLMTEALKKSLTISTNVIALINAIVVGAGGTSAAYVLLDVSFSSQNVICIILMTICIWIGSMIGYDKVIQTISQIRR